jgi:hypothetical protein
MNLLSESGILAGFHGIMNDTGFFPHRFWKGNVRLNGRNSALSESGFNSRWPWLAERCIANCHKLGQEPIPNCPKMEN